MRIYKISQSAQYLVSIFGVNEEFASEIETLLSNFKNGTKEKKYLTKYLKNNAVVTLEDFKKFKELCDKNQNQLETESVDSDLQKLITAITDDVSYRKWLIVTYKDGLWNRTDVAKLRKLLIQFTSLKEKLEIGIDKFESPNDLYEFVQRYSEEISNSDIKESLNKDGIEVFVSEMTTLGQLQLLRVTSCDRLNEIAGDANWCVLDSDTFNSSDYEDGEFFVIVLNGDVQGLISTSTGEILNKQDKEIKNPILVESIFPVLKSSIYDLLDDDKYFNNMMKIYDYLEKNKIILSESSDPHVINKIVKQNAHMVYYLSDEKKLMLYDVDFDMFFIQNSLLDNLSYLYFLYRENNHPLLESLRKGALDCASFYVFDIRKKIPPIILKDPNFRNVFEPLYKQALEEAISLKYFESLAFNSVLTVDKQFSNLLKMNQLLKDQTLQNYANIKKEEYASIKKVRWHTITLMEDYVKSMDLQEADNSNAANAARSFYDRLLTEEGNSEILDNFLYNIQKKLINNVDFYRKEDWINFCIERIVETGSLLGIGLLKEASFYENCSYSQKRSLDQVVLEEIKRLQWFPPWAYDWNLQTDVVQAIDEYCVLLMKKLPLEDVFYAGVEKCKYLSGALKRNTEFKKAFVISMAETSTVRKYGNNFVYDNMTESSQKSHFQMFKDVIYEMFNNPSIFTDKEWEEWFERLKNGFVYISDLTNKTLITILENHNEMLKIPGYSDFYDYIVDMALFYINTYVKNKNYTDARYYIDISNTSKFFSLLNQIGDPKFNKILGVLDLHRTYP